MTTEAPSVLMLSEHMDASDGERRERVLAA